MTDMFKGILLFPAIHSSEEKKYVAVGVAGIFFNFHS